MFLCISIFPLLFSTVSAEESNTTYGVIYNEIASYNGNAQEVEWITQAILYVSNIYGVDPLLITSIMEQESKFNLSSNSPAGAIGLMQIMPGTADMIGVNPYDPLGNIIGGVSYLKSQIEKFEGWGIYAVTYAVAAYNAGPQAILQYSGVPPYNETQNYVRNVAENYSRLLSMA